MKPNHPQIRMWDVCIEGQDICLKENKFLVTLQQFNSQNFKMSTNKPITKQKYGFFCPETHKFYYVQDYALYLEILNYFSTFNNSNQQLSSIKGQQVEKGISEEVQSSMEADQESIDYYCQLMDKEIEEIYKDPMFLKKQMDIELKQYDF